MQKSVRRGQWEGGWTSVCSLGVDGRWEGGAGAGAGDGGGGAEWSGISIGQKAAVTSACFLFVALYNLRRFFFFASFCDFIYLFCVLLLRVNFFLVFFEQIIIMLVLRRLRLASLLILCHIVS